MNPLETLDQIVWKQYEKVTNYCNDKVGWNKYDLAKLSNDTAGIFAVGTTVYSAINSYFGMNKFVDQPNFSNLWDVIVSLACIPLYLSFAKTSYKESQQYKEKEEKEYQSLLETGAVKQPTISATRPAALFCFLYCISWGIYQLHGSISNNSETPQNLTKVAAALLTETVGFYGSFYTSKDYFEEQILTPPKTKGLFKIIYDRIRNKFRRKTKATSSISQSQSIGIDYQFDEKS